MARKKKSRLLSLEVFRVGDYGEDGKYEVRDLETIVADYSPEFQEAPVTVDHAWDGPAMGWVTGLSHDGTVLFASMELTEAFAELLAEGVYRKRSVEIYRPHPQTKRLYLKAVSFLGASPPRVKGLRDVEFAEGESVEVDFEESSKIEGGVPFPRAAYAHAPSDDSSSWRIRMWADLAEGLTEESLKAAEVELAGSDLVGEALEAAKNVLQAAYGALGLEPLQESAKESDFSSFSSLGKGHFDAEKGEATVTVIVPGFNSTRTCFYPPSVLLRDFGVFKGAKMFVDHDTPKERAERPEGSVGRWAAQLSRVWVERDGRVRGLAKIIDKIFLEKLKRLDEVGMLGEMGVSIRVRASGHVATMSGSSVVVADELLSTRSVDFVTEPGAGGRVELLESTGTVPDEQAASDEARKSVEAINMEELEKVKADLEAANEQVEALTAEIVDLKRDVALREAHEKVETVLGEAKDLPEPAVKRLRAQFSEVESIDGLQEAIEAELDYIGAIRSVGSVKGVGAASSEAPTRLKEVLRRTFANQGFGEAEAERRATVATGV